jgi:hypothetical protein
MFSAQLQEVNLKYFIISIYFTYVSLSALTFLLGFQAFGFVQFLFGLVVTENHLTTHTHTHTYQHFTNSFSLRTTSLHT